MLGAIIGGIVGVSIPALFQIPNIAAWCWLGILIGVSGTWLLAAGTSKNGETPTSTEQGSPERVSQAQSPLPREIGLMLAQTLDTICIKERFSKEQRELIADCRIPEDKYFDEFVVLSALGIAFSINSLLTGAIKEEARAGFFDGIRDWPVQSTKKSVKLQMMIQTLGPSYFKAASELFSQEPDILGDPVAFAFLDRIFPQHATRPALAVTLASISVHLSFHLYYDMGQHALIESGLFVPSTGVG